MNKNVYDVVFNETIKHVVRVEATSKEEAEAIASYEYYGDEDYLEIDEHNIVDVERADSSVISKISEPIENEFIDIEIMNQNEILDQLYEVREYFSVQQPQDDERERTMLEYICDDVIELEK